MSYDITLNYKFDSSYLAQPPYEYNPHLFWWCSFDRSWTFTQKLDFTNGDLRSDVHQVKVPINQVNFEADDSIWVICLVENTLPDHTPATSKTGSTQILLKDIMNYKNEVTLDMRMFQFIENDTPYLKGKLILSTEKSSLVKLKSAKFGQAKEYHLLEENKDLLMKVVAWNVNRETCLFENTFKEKLLDEVSMLQSNFFFTEVGVMGGCTFWFDWDNHKLQEDYFNNLMTIGLERNGWTSSKFISVVNKQFESNDTSISLDFTRACRIFFESISAPAVCVPYKEDAIYTEKRDSHDNRGYDPKKEESIKKSIESFSYPMYDVGKSGGDCEDKGNCIVIHFGWIEKGIPEKKDLNSKFSKLGGWDSPLLKTAQKIAHVYVCCGVLGTVTASFLGESDEGKKASPSIQSNDFVNANVGGHIWAQAFTRHKFRNAISNVSTKELENCDILKTEFPWEENPNFNNFICEGTGEMRPDFLPARELSSKEEERKELEKEQMNLLLAKQRAFLSSDFIKAGSIQMQQMMKEDKNDNTLTSFYRLAVQIYTYKLVQTDVPISAFYPVTKGDRSNSNLNDTSKWVHGCHVKDIIRGEKWFGLLAVPGYTSTERLVYNSLFRHMMPRKKPVYKQASIAHGKFVNISEKFATFTRKCKHVEEEIDHKLVNVYFSVEKLETLTDDRLKKFAEDIEKNDDISSCEWRFENFNENAYQMRLDLSVSTKPKPENLIKSSSRLISQNSLNIGSVNNHTYLSDFNLHSKKNVNPNFKRGKASSFIKKYT
jgi:hypothetical protein